MYAKDISLLKIDQPLATAHLRELGYQQGDAVFMRYIHPKTKKSMKASKLNFTEANHYQNQGYDAYFVVNGGGDADKAVTKCRAIFYEHDNLDKATQLGLWQSLGLPAPTLQVDTSGKSIHSYWVLTDLISPEQWKELQADLLEFSDGDRTLKNPSRIMRLAGCYYMKGDNPGATTAKIVSHSRQHYSYEELREVIPQAQQQGQFTLLQQPPTIRFENITLPVPESVPLEFCLSKGSRSLLQSGVSKGGRNVNGAKLARDLIGTANYLQSIGQRFDGDPLQLFLDYCHRCPSGSGWNEVEWKNIWKSAEGDHPTPSCKEDGVEACVRAWYWSNYVKSSIPKCDRGLDSTPLREGKHSGSSSGTPPTIKTLSVGDRILEILSRNLSVSQRKEAFFELASSTGRQVREIEKLAEAIESEVDLTAGRADRADELNQLLEIGNRRLTLSCYLPSILAQPLERLTGWMGVDAEALLTALIPSAASLLHPETRVIVKECIDFDQPMVFYTGIVTETGNRKSPIFKAINKPLKKLQKEEDARHKLALEEYEADLHNWEQDGSKNKGPKPKPPALREYYVDNITSEALDRIKANQPEHGLLIYKDELSGLFASYGAYKKGRGSDKEGVLSGWNGNGVKKNRVTGDRVSLSHDASSISGAIPPGTLRKIMGDMEDEQGEWARFLWYLAPLKAFRLPDEDTQFEVGGLLEDIYRKLDKLEPVQYRFTSDAQRLYQNWHWELEQRKLAEPKQGMRAAIAKMEGYTARLAGILHILWSTASDETPEPYIPIERVKAAKTLAEFYLGQVRLMHSDGEADQGERTSILNSILKKVRHTGKLAIRDAQSSIKALRKTKAPQVLEYFKELEAMGHAIVEGKTLVALSADRSADRSATTRTVDNGVSQPLADQSADQSATTRTVDDGMLQPLADKTADRADHNLASETENTDPWSESKPDELLKKGDLVSWDDAPGHITSWSPFTITVIENGMALLDMYSKLVPLSELRRVSTG